MRTGKHISSIAYHRPEVFALTTNSLRKAGVIGPCLWVAHLPEGSEKKAHIHLLLLGGYKTYNTEGLSSLWGVDIFDGQKASVVDLWKVTRDPSDWLLYGIHDIRYLDSKALEREHHYDWEDIKVTDGDEDILGQLRMDAEAFLDQLGDKTIRRLKLMAARGWTWPQVVCSGQIPTPQLSQAHAAYSLIYAQYGKPLEIEKGEDSCKE